jgi:hypothetical protein
MGFDGTVLCVTSIFMCISSSVGARDGVLGIGTIGAGSAFSRYLSISIKDCIGQQARPAGCFQVPIKAPMELVWM